ncbi:bifunctional glutathione transferase/peroxidase [Podospora pseudocomata]|uniref:Bifunctional glutathione transferase/peroxidase n=1 Tax=Podospora pseudocomata TaxID=2093779 RepID=A0ABR0G5L1_9PEZI|nr:bifunctional glutathione transferase/peroxidase [Podospora pseudocomata]
MTSPNPQAPPQSTSTLSPSNKPEIPLYWLNDYRVQRVVWLLEELDLTYTVRPFHRTPSGLAPRELGKVYP